jgi:hypothetical protein
MRLRPTADVLLVAVRPLAGVMAAFLPRRKWDEWEGRVPVRAMALPAALATIFAGFAIGIPGFLAFALSMGSMTGDLVLESSHQVNVGHLPGEAPAVAWFGMMLALPAFLLATPTGLATAYLVGSGLVRAMCWAADDPRGDPLVSLADVVIRSGLREGRLHRERAARNALEGPQVADVLVRGRAIGVPEATYALIASRLKPGWSSGVFLLTETGRFRIGERFDRRFPDGLRAIYPLYDVPGAEATRRRLNGALPSLSEWDAVDRRPRSG